MTTTSDVGILIVTPPGTTADSKQTVHNANI